MYYLNNCRFDFKESNSNMHYPPFMAKCISWQFQSYKLIFMAFICFLFNRNFRIVIKYIVIIFAFLKSDKIFLWKKKSRNSRLQILEIWILNWMYCDSQKNPCSTKCFEFFKIINIIMNCATSMHMSNI